MELLIYLVSILFILVIYTVVSTIIRTSLFLTTKYKYENYRLFLPTVFTIISWIITLFSLSFMIKKTTNTSLLEIIFNHIIKIESISNYSTTLILLFIIHLIFFIILQAFSYFLTNVNIKNFFNYIRYNIKKVIFKNYNNAEIKKDYIQKEDNNIESNSINDTDSELDAPKDSTENLEINSKSQIKAFEPLESLNFINALIASLLSTSIIVIFIVGLFLWGVSLSVKILNY